jgi:hypothetical protein
MCNFVRWRRRNLRPDEVVVTSGNNKIGRTPSLSLMPRETCDCRAPCTRPGGCYAVKMICRGGKDWTHNTTLAVDNPAQFFASLREQFAQRAGRVPFFRFFVAGDFPTKDFFARILTFAREHPDTRFLVFTKRYQWADDLRRARPWPRNISVILSAWPGYRLDNPHGLPVAWMQDGTETRVPDDALPCPGSCEGCGMCWSLPELHRDVVFNKH